MLDEFIGDLYEKAEYLGHFGLQNPRIRDQKTPGLLDDSAQVTNKLAERSHSPLHETPGGPKWLFSEGTGAVAHISAP